jgi:Ni/Fe-hydrogenase subunit HybB-like protein
VTRVPKFSISRWVFAALVVAGAYAAYARVAGGLGGATNLNDGFPWGIWIGFDVLCGVGLATGGFTVATMAYVFNLRPYEPVVRPAVLTAFLGYLLEILAVLFDLGRPDRFWHALVMWNPRSPMFEVGWCVALSTIVLFLQFLPPVLERFGLDRSLRLARAVLVPLVVAGAVLSALHQWTLGSLYLIAPHKTHPLWYSLQLPLLFYVSAVCAGLAMTVFESCHSRKAFGIPLEVPLLARISRLLSAGLLVYAVIRIADLWHRGAWRLIRPSRPEAALFLAEMSLLLVPAALLLGPRWRRDPRWLHASSVMVILGFVAHRLNVSITAMQPMLSLRYVPKWTEVAVTLASVALGIAAFGFLVKRLPFYRHAGDLPTAR